MPLAKTAIASNVRPLKYYPMPISVRPVQIDDIPELLRLLRAKAAFDGVEHTLKANEENLARDLLSPDATTRAIVATKDGEIIGMATYFQTFSSFLMKPGLWLDDLYVEEHHRRRGVGTRLLTWLCREAASSGCARIDWIVAANNDNGLGFYQRMGATVFESVRLARIEEGIIQQHATGTPDVTSGNAINKL